MAIIKKQITKILNPVLELIEKYHNGKTIMKLVTAVVRSNNKKPPSHSKGLRKPAINPFVRFFRKSEIIYSFFPYNINLKCSASLCLPNISAIGIIFSNADSNSNSRESEGYIKLRD